MAAPTDDAGKGGGGDKSTVYGHRPVRPGHIAATKRSADLLQSPSGAKTSSLSSSASSSALSAAAASSTAFKQPLPPTSAADVVQQEGRGDKTKVSQPETAAIKRAPARKSTLGRPAAIVLAPAEADSVATLTPTSAKGLSSSSRLPQQEPAASSPTESSFSAETGDNAQVRPSSLLSSSSSSAAAAASTKAAAASRPRPQTSTKPSDAGLASATSERGPPSSAAAAAVVQSSAAARAPPKPASRLPASVATASPPSARRPKAPPLVVAAPNAQGSYASSPEKTPSSADAGRDPLTSADQAVQPIRPSTSTASSSIGRKSSSVAEMAARSTPPPPPEAQLDSTVASKSPSGSRLPAAVRNRSPLRAASEGVSPARSGSNVNMDVDARPASARTTEFVSQKEGAPVSTSPTRMDDSDSDIEFITPAPKSAPVSSHAAPVARTEEGLADTKIAPAREVATAQAKTSLPDGEPAAAAQVEGASATEAIIVEPTSKSSPAAPSSGGVEPAAQSEQTQPDRVEDGKTASAGLSTPKGDAVSGANDVTMRDVPPVRRDLERFASPATSTSSPSHTPAPGDPSVPSRRIYGRGHKSTGGRLVKKHVNRVRAVESEESATDAVEASAQAFKTLALAKQSLRSIAPPRLREDSDMAEATDNNETDGTSSASDSSESSSCRLQQSLLLTRPPSRATDALTESDRVSQAFKAPITAEGSRFSQDPNGRDQSTLETTFEVERRDEFVGPRSRRQDFSDLKGQDSSSSATIEKGYKHAGKGRKSTGPWAQRKSQHKTLDSVVPLGPSLAVSASDLPEIASHPEDLDQQTESGSATDRLPKSSVVERPLKRERVASADSAQLGPGWAVMASPISLR